MAVYAQEILKDGRAVRGGEALWMSGDNVEVTTLSPAEIRAIGVDVTLGVKPPTKIGVEPDVKVCKPNSLYAWLDSLHKDTPHEKS